MESGWIKISRRITEMHGYFGEKFSRAMCWLDLLLLAEWREERVFYLRGNKVTLTRGQLAVSQNELSKRWKLNKRTVASRLQDFVSEEQITIEHTSVIDIITIVNYERYQSENDCSSYCQETAPQNAPQTAPQKTTAKRRKSSTCESESETTAPQNAPQNTPQTAPQTAPLLKNIKNNNILADTPFSRICSSETSSDTQSDDVDVVRFCEFFNSEMQKANAIIPRVRSITGQRLQFLKARCREFGKKAVCEAITKAAQSNFLNGGGSRGFTADFTWIFRTNNFPRVLEGAFDNNSNHNNSSNNENNKSETKAQRRGYDVTATSAEDYKTTF